MHQNGVNGDLAENGGTSHKVPAHTRESQGKNTKDENKRYNSSNQHPTVKQRIYDRTENDKETSNTPTLLCMYFTNNRYM